MTSLRMIYCALVVEGRERRVGLWGIDVITETLVEIRENVSEGEGGGVHWRSRTGKETSSPPIISESSAQRAPKFLFSFSSIFSCHTSKIRT
jgi:hypothetical protein